MILAIVPVFSNPICLKVLPASIDLYIPIPGNEARKIFASPVPTYKMFLSEGAKAISPIDCVASLSNIGFQVFPASSVFHKPPVANAA